MHKKDMIKYLLRPSRYFATLLGGEKRIELNKTKEKIAYKWK